MILQDFCILLSKGKQHTSTSGTTALCPIFPIKTDALSQELHGMGVLQYHFLHHYRIEAIE